MIESLNVEQGCRVRCAEHRQLYRSAQRTLRLCLVIILGLSASLFAQSESAAESNAAATKVVVPEDVLKAEQHRIETIDRVASSVVAIFAPKGEGGGSGVLISADGFVVTNFHVVQGLGGFMKCGLNDGKVYDAVLVGIDPTGDVAVIKLLGRDDFPFAEIGDSDSVRMGDWTFAMGNPFLLADDFQPTVTYGMVSIGNGNADAANVLDRDGSTGWSTATREGESHQLVLNFKEPLAAEFPLEIELLFERHFAASLGRFRFSFTSNNETTVASPLPVEVEVQLASVGIKELSDEIRNELTRHFLQLTPQLAEARKPIEALKKQLAEFPTTMIFGERPADNPRLTYRHHRGEYLQPQEQVKPSLPELFQSTTKVVPSNRLEFAKWLVSDENPLIGRVTVNRNWQEFFGRGLVRTSEDFGIQSSFPSHPELLDWLAVAFISDEDEQPLALNWSVKELHRLIVMSATYRQQSYVDQEQLQQDPENILLSRGPRFRLNAEIIRDSTLQASGLLHQKMGGPSVYPPQPGIVYSTAYGSPKWPISKGTDRYRRSLYTFTKRTAPFAAYTVFDAPTGENCIVRRDRSNTPLQALTMLNDGMFLEAAQAAAKKAFSANRPEEVIAEELFRSFLTRPPTQNELTTLLAFYHQQLERLQSNELDAKQFLPNEETPSPEIAAWVMVARVILNLDETVTKP
ncbi:DUF1553 domain-containing protein [bacterium]|nr:DUF1553 domain-containing protein [bacterium]